MVEEPQSCTACMSGSEFRARLRELGRTQGAFAREIGSSHRSVNRWSSEGPPPEVAYLLDLLATLELHMGMAPVDLPPDEGDLPVRVELDRILARAMAVGRRAETLEEIRTWLSDAAGK